MTHAGRNRRRSGSDRIPVLTSLAVLIGVVVLCTAAYALTVVFTRTVDGPASAADAAADVAVAPNRDFYVVGYVTVPGQNKNIWIRKYSSAGTKRWTRTITSPGADYDVANGAAVDSTGNLYVVGTIYKSPTETYNIWIRKYNSSGDKLWTRTVNGPDSSADSALAAAIDSNDDLYVVGRVTVAGESNNIWVRKYNSSGGKLWTRTVNGRASFSSDYASGAAIDNADNLYVVGSIVTTTDQNRDIWIRKYSSSGKKIWTRKVSGPAGGMDGATAAASDSAGNLFVVGRIEASVGNQDIWIRKYGPAGNKLWTRTFGGPDGVDDEAFGCAVDGAGALYVAGKKGKTGTYDIWIRKYSALGSRIWTTSYNAFGVSASYGISIDANTRVIAVGGAMVAGHGEDIWVRKYRQ